MLSTHLGTTSPVHNDQMFFKESRQSVLATYMPSAVACRFRFFYDGHGNGCEECDDDCDDHKDDEEDDAADCCSYFSCQQRNRVTSPLTCSGLRMFAPWFGVSLWLKMLWFLFGLTARLPLHGPFRKLGYLILGYYVRVPYFRKPPHGHHLTAGTSQGRAWVQVRPAAVAVGTGVHPISSPICPALS